VRESGLAYIKLGHWLFIGKALGSLVGVPSQNTEFTYVSAVTWGGHHQTSRMKECHSIPLS